MGTTSKAPSLPIVEPASRGTTRGLAVRLSGVSKRYGTLWALRDVSLEIQPGEFVTLLGANGSGKSTLLKVMALVARPSVGRGEFGARGKLEDGAAVRARIGFVAHSTMLYDELSALENLEFFGRLYGVDSARQRAKESLAAVGLEERSDSVVRTFSRGMRQRVALARALLHQPGLLLLDEPAAGLDTEGQQWLARLLESLRDAGCTMVMSTHGAGEVASLATRCVRLDAGRVVESQ